MDFYTIGAQAALEKFAVVAGPIKQYRRTLGMMHGDTLHHRTSSAAAGEILDAGSISPSPKGAFGPGVYTAVGANNNKSYGPIQLSFHRPEDVDAFTGSSGDPWGVVPRAVPVSDIHTLTNTVPGKSLGDLEPLARRNRMRVVAPEPYKAAISHRYFGKAPDKKALIKATLAARENT